jgi:DNA-binding transcriptional LysR family regulator
MDPIAPIDSFDASQLRAFDQVVREGSFSRAALALGIGQPAVSARIQSLENAVGGALFTRGRRIALTALGESFLPYVRRALEVLREGVAAAQEAQVGRRGRVRLGALASLCGGLLGPALARFVATHPDVECTLKAADHEVVVEWLLDGLVELALITWPCTESAAADLTPLVRMREPVVLVAHPEHELARKRRVSEDELVRGARPLLRLRWWQTHHPAINRLVERAGTPLDAPMETARHLVMHGVGAAFFTRTYVADELARGVLQSIEVRGLAPIFRGSALVRRSRSGPLSPASADLIQAILAQARTLGLLTTPAGPPPAPATRGCSPPPRDRSTARSRASPSRRRTTRAAARG